MAQGPDLSASLGEGSDQMFKTMAMKTPLSAMLVFGSLDEAGLEQLLQALNAS